MQVGQLDVFMSKETLVRRDGQGNVEICRKKRDGSQEWFYWLPEVELLSRRGLLQWIGHLSEKNWITRTHILQLMDVSHDLMVERTKKL